MHRAFILSLCLTSILFGDTPTQGSAPDMKAFTPYQQGIQALSDHLPELAVTRFQEAYKIPNLEDAQNREILYRLTESQVRANQPEKALVTLNSKFFKDHPEREFWIAQALAAQGKYAESLEHFKKLDAKSSYKDAATLSMASIQLALGFEKDAIANYLVARKSKDETTRLKATATLAEIYINNGELKEAANMIQGIPSSARSELLKEVLNAQFSLANKKYTDAIAQFSSLVEKEEQLPPRLYQITLIGLADSRYAADQKQEAVVGMLSFINEHQDSPILLPMFERLSAWSIDTTSPNDPFYQQIEKWAERDADAQNNIGFQIISDSILNPFPPARSLSRTSPYLKAIAQYYYARHTAQLSAAGSLAKAQFEHSLFRLTYPEHPLFASSLFDTAKIQITLKQRYDALYTLRTLENLVRKKQITISPEAQTQAGFIAGMLNVEAENYTEAVEAFGIASKANNSSLANAAKINLGLAALRSSDLAAFDAQQNNITDQELATQLSIEKALWLAHQNHPDARGALSTFLSKHPNSERIVDARISLASICVTQSPLDPILSKALLDSVDVNSLDINQRTEFTRTSYLLATIKQDWTSAIAVIDGFLNTFPNSPSKEEFTMRKGLALYRNGEHNKARQIFGQIALENPESPLVDFCHYHAAMAARLEGTPQSLKESVDLFEKVIASNNSLSTEARIQQARVLLDINRTEEAKISLNKVYDPKSNSFQQREIGILLATALHTQGNEDPGQYAKAVAIYDQLLSNKNLSLAWSNQIHYMKGQTLESMGEDQLALDSYYKVINRENLDPEAPDSQQEWKWFYKCGFKSIALLEKNQQFRAAVKIAKRIASYGGPESETYEKRARALEMQHMIWEE